MNGLSFFDIDRYKKVFSFVMVEIVMRILYVLLWLCVWFIFMKKFKIRLLEDFDLGDICLWISSLLIRNFVRKFNFLEIRLVGILYEDSEYDLYRVRIFEKIVKGLVNWGDFFILRSINSVVFFGSEFGVLLRILSLMF